MRNSMRLSAATPVFRSGIACCTATAQRTASTTLANSTSRPSPVVLTMRPLCSAIFGSRSSRRSALRRSSVPSSSAPISREYPATSAARIAARRRVWLTPAFARRQPRARLRNSSRCSGLPELAVARAPTGGHGAQPSDDRARFVKAPPMWAQHDASTRYNLPGAFERCCTAAIGFGIASSEPPTRKCSAWNPTTGTTEDQGGRAG